MSWFLLSQVFLLCLSITACFWPSPSYPRMIGQSILSLASGLSPVLLPLSGRWLHPFFPSLHASTLEG